VLRFLGRNIEYLPLFCAGLIWQFLDGFLKSRGRFVKPSAIKLLIRSIAIIVKVYVIFNFDIHMLFIIYFFEGLLIFLLLIPVSFQDLSDEAVSSSELGGALDSAGHVDNIRIAFFGWINFVNNNFYVLFGSFFMEVEIVGFFYFYMRCIDLGALLATPNVAVSTYKLRINRHTRADSNRTLIVMAKVWLACSLAVFAGYLYRLKLDVVYQYEFLGVSLLCIASMPFILGVMRVSYHVINGYSGAGILQGLTTFGLSMFVVYSSTVFFNSQLPFWAVCACLVVTRVSTCWLSPSLFRAGRRYLHWQYR